MRVVVIGSGFGGLAAAIRLQQQGHDVTILEKRDKPGGRAYVYEQDGFTFDGGPTIITAPWLIHELFERSGRRTRDYVDLVPIDPFYNIRFEDGSVFRYTGDRAQVIEQIRRIAPEDVGGYERFAAATERIFESGMALIDTPFDRLTDMLRVVPDLVRLFEELGGTLWFDSEVGEIAIDPRTRRATGVRLAEGDVVPADAVVSNGDVATTYMTLVPSAYRRRNTDRRFRRMRYSMSLFVMYFGTDRRYDDVAHHEILMGPRYRGLLDDIFTRKSLADDFSLYLHRPTATDPSLAPPGCDSWYVLSPVPNLGGSTDWRTAARPYRDRIVEYLERRYLPNLSRHIVTERTIDPLHFRDTLNSHLGSAFSVEPILPQSAWFRPHKGFLRRSAPPREMPLLF